MSTDPESLVMGWTEAINRRDIDAAVGYWHEQCVFTNTGTMQRFEGPAGLRQDLEQLLTMFSDVHFTKTNFLVVENAFADEWIMRGVHTGDGPGMPATGRPFEIHGAGVGEVREGKLYSATQYWNVVEFLTQVGLMPVPAGSR